MFGGIRYHNTAHLALVCRPKNPIFCDTDFHTDLWPSRVYGEQSQDLHRIMLIICMLLSRTSATIVSQVCGISVYRERMQRDSREVTSLELGALLQASQVASVGEIWLNIPSEPRGPPQHTVKGRI